MRPPNTKPRERPGEADENALPRRRHPASFAEGHVAAHAVELDRGPIAERHPHQRMTHFVDRDRHEHDRNPDRETRRVTLVQAEQDGHQEEARP